MRRVFFLLLVLVLSLSAASVAFAQDDAPVVDPNACLTGGSMEGQCDLPTDAEDEWAWTCGYYVGLYDDDDISRDQIPDWCYYPEAGTQSNCFLYYEVDMQFIGPINTANNIAVYNSMDASCSGNLIGTATIVEALDSTSADALCLSLTGYGYAIPLDPAMVGHNNYWGCVAVT